MNLLCVSHSVDIINYGMLEAMAKQGVNVYVTYTSEKEKQAIRPGCKGLLIPSFRSKFKWNAIRAIHKIIRQYHIDIIYALNSADLSNALFSTYFTSAKVVGYRGTQARIRRSDLTYYMGILNPRIAHIMCATQDIKHQLSRDIPLDKMTLNPKPYDVKWVEDALLHPKTVEEVPADAFKVICVANTQGRPYKGLTILIRAMHLLQDPAIHLIHVGDYDTADYQLAKEGPAAPYIHFLGVRSDAVYYLPSSDVCICPSIRDASPRSLREAMACKVSCIVTDILGARELVIKDKTGLIIEPNSPEAIAESIRYLVAHPEQNKSFGEAGYERIKTDYTMEKYVANLKTVFERVLQK